MHRSGRVAPAFSAPVPAHAAGACDAQFHADGRFLFTCGPDGARCYDMAKLSQSGDGNGCAAEWEESSESPLTALALSGDGKSLACASANRSVLSWRVSILEKEGSGITIASDTNLKRCKTLVAARAVALPMLDGFVLAGDDGGQIKQWRKIDGSVSRTLLAHEGGGVRSVITDTSSGGGEFIVTTGCDGSLKIWSMTDKEPLKTLSSLVVDVEPTDLEIAGLGRPAFSPTGQYLAVPCADGSLQILQRSSWEVKARLIESESGSATPLQCVAWSSNGLYLVTTDAKNRMWIWDASKWGAGGGAVESLGKKSHDKAISSICWCPKANAITFIDVEGQIVVWSQPVPRGHPRPFRQRDMKARDTLLAQLFPESDNEDNDDEADAVMQDATIDGVVGNNDRAELDDVDALFSDAAPQPVTEQPTRLVRRDPKDKRDELDIIDGVFDAPQPAAQKRSARAESSASNAPRPVLMQHDLCQPPFQPSATNDEVSPSADGKPAKKSYLFFNKLGFIWRHKERSTCTLTIEFHDKQRRKAVKLQDRHGVTLAALGPRGCVFGAPRSKSSPAMVVYQGTEFWDSNVHWSIPLRLDEDVVGVAISRDFVAVATSLNAVRVFSYAGTQVGVFNVCRPILCIVGNGNGKFSATGKPLGSPANHCNMFAILSHVSLPINKTQCVQVNLLDCDATELGGSCRLHLGGQSVPVSPGSWLRWVGFANQPGDAVSADAHILRNTLVVSDGAGRVSIAQISTPTRLHYRANKTARHSTLGSFIPMCDFASTDSQAWVFAADLNVDAQSNPDSSGHLNVLMLPLSPPDSVLGPLRFPVPTPDTLPFRVPVLPRDLSSVEELLIREQAFRVQDGQETLDDEASLRTLGRHDGLRLRLCQAAMDAEPARSERVLQLARLLRFPEKILPALIDHAHNKSLPTLADKLNELRIEREEEEAQVQAEIETLQSQYAFDNDDYESDGGFAAPVETTPRRPESVFDSGDESDSIENFSVPATEFGDDEIEAPRGGTRKAASSRASVAAGDVLLVDDGGDDDSEEKRLDRKRRRASKFSAEPSRDRMTRSGSVGLADLQQVSSEPRTFQETSASQVDAALSKKSATNEAAPAKRRRTAAKASSSKGSQGSLKAMFGKA